MTRFIEKMTDEELKILLKEWMRKRFSSQYHGGQVPPHALEDFFRFLEGSAKKYGVVVSIEDEARIRRIALKID